MKPPDHNTHWSEFTTQYLPGDLVQTEHGPAVIQEAKSNPNGDSYSVWPLPGWKWLPWVSHVTGENIGWLPVKHAWYDNDELTLIEAGPASKRRPGSVWVVNVG